MAEISSRLAKVAFQFLIAISSCVAQPTSPQGGVPCDLGRGNWIWCQKGTVCDPARQMCSEPVKIPEGHKACPDGLTTCPNNLVCNMEAPPGFSDRCIVPGSKRCDLRPYPTWCKPGTVCDMKRMMCAEPVKVPAGHIACPDGLTTCPKDQVCNLEDPVGWPCMAPGSIRCGPPVDTNRPIMMASRTFWCKPGTVCDMKRMMCAEPVKVPAGHIACPDGLTTCPKDQVCNLEDPVGWPCMAPGSIRCGPPVDPNQPMDGFSRSRTFWCKPGTVCDMKRMMCAEPVKVPEGHVACPDGLTTCPKDQVCNLEDPVGWPCLTPGSIRCGPPVDPNQPMDGFSRTRTFWCKPGTVCDMQRMMCAEPDRGGRDYTSPAIGGGGAPSTLSVAAQPDQATPAVVPKGAQVVGFGDRKESEVDAWIPFKFSFSPPLGGADKATFVLVVRPIGQLVETDTFHCADSDGKGQSLYNHFAALTSSKPSVVKVSIDKSSHPKIMQQINTGTLQCCVQDDTALFSAKMLLESGTKKVGP